MSKILISIILLLGALNLSAQESEEFKKNSFTGNMAFSFVPKALGPNMKEAILIVPTIGLKYDRALSYQWRVGVHTDFMLEQFEIQQEGRIDLTERSYPINVCAMVSYVFPNNILLSAGVGQEFETHQTFTTITFGAEYEIKLSEDWDVILMSSWDYRVSHYSSLLAGVGFARSF